MTLWHISIQLLDIWYIHHITLQNLFIQLFDSLLPKHMWYIHHEQLLELTTY